DAHGLAPGRREVEDLVPRARRAVVELDDVREARAATPLEPEAQGRLGRPPLDELASDGLGGGGRDVDRAGLRRGRVRRGLRLDLLVRRLVHGRVHHPYSALAWRPSGWEVSP